MSLILRIKKRLKYQRSKRLMKKFESLVPGPEGIAIDCGANIGKITSVLASKGAKVYAFEPHPMAYEALTESLSLRDQVQCFQQAVHIKDGMMKLYLHEHHQENELKLSVASSLVQEKCNLNTEDYIEVKVINLCQFIQDLNQPIQILKLDVEGVEFEILKEILCSGLHQKINHIFVETHELKIPSLALELQSFKKELKARQINNIYLNWQ